MLIPLVHGEPIRFGADHERGVQMGTDGALRIVEVADVGADAILVHDETNQGLAFQLSRLASGPHEPTPIGVFRAVDRPDYGTEVSRQLAAAPGAQRRRRPALAAALGRHLDGRTDRAAAPEPDLSRAGADHHAGAAGLGWKNVVFGGMRSPPWAMATIWATVAGRNSTPAWASPAVDPSHHVVDAVLEHQLVGGQPGQRGVEPAGVEVADTLEAIGSRHHRPCSVRRDQHEGTVGRPSAR